MQMYDTLKAQWESVVNSVENWLSNYDLDYDCFPSHGEIMKPFTPILVAKGYNETEKLLQEYFQLIMEVRSARYWSATMPWQYSERLSSLRQRIKGLIADAAGDKIAPAV